MVRAVAEDFINAGVEITLLRDSRFRDHEFPCCTVQEVTDAKQEQYWISKLAANTDWTLVIAPEFSGLLWDRVRRVEAAGGRLLSPQSDFVALAADKWTLNQQLSAVGVPVPLAVLLDDHLPRSRLFPYPAVAKPRYGAGSMGVQRVDSATQPIDRDAITDGGILEALYPGVAASIAIIGGLHSNYVLAPTEQRLSDDGRFRYRGGRLPLPLLLARRAVRLAHLVMPHLPRWTGYVGFDLVLGNAQAEDVIIELNPRLTTSYLGLRRLAKCNLAAVMLAAATGRAIDIEYQSQVVEFSADGTLVEGAGS